jgi:hypothetical protein
MLANTLKVVVGAITYLVDSPKDDGGLKATVRAVREEMTAQGVPNARTLHHDRINLDVAKARTAFAENAGTDAADLLEVCSRVRDYITPVAQPADETPEPADPETVEHANSLLADPNLLDQLGTAIRASGYAGDLHNLKLLYLALTSRVTTRPINVLVGGPSSAGKNFLVDTVVAFFPAAAVYLVGAMSERALVYTDADFEHRHVVISEAAAIHRDGIGTLIMRCLVWGNQLDYEVTEQDPEGGLRTRRIIKPGPTGLITTSVKDVEDELNTRLLTLTVADDEAATRDILVATGRRATGDHAAGPDLRVWHEAQRWLAEDGAHEVVIPFASELATLFPAKLIRARRDFPQLLALIEASAILHQQQRERDEHGRIIASETDYRIVYDLAAPVFGAAASEGIAPAVRETVAKVAELTKDTEGGTISAHALGTALKLGKAAISRRVGLALKGGFLVNEEPIKGKPSKLRVGDPLPEHANLPAPGTLFGAPTLPEIVRTVEYPAKSRRSDAEMTVRMGESNTRTVRSEYPHHSNGLSEQQKSHNGAETSELFECSSAFAEEGGGTARPSTSTVNGADPVVTMSKRLAKLSPQDLATYRKEVGTAPPDDPHLHLDRQALALFDAMHAAAPEHDRAPRDLLPMPRPTAQ